MISDLQKRLFTNILHNSYFEKLNRHKVAMELFFKSETFKSLKEVMESFFNIKNFKSRKKAMQPFFSMKNFKS